VKERESHLLQATSSEQNTKGQNVTGEAVTGDLLIVCSSQSEWTICPVVS